MAQAVLRHAVFSVQDDRGLVITWMDLVTLAVNKMTTPSCVEVVR